MKFKSIKYVRFDFQRSVETLKSITNSLINAKNVKEAYAAYKSYVDLITYYYDCSSLAYIRFTQDINDPKYNEEMNYYNQIGPTFEKELIPFKNALLKCKFKKELKNGLISPTVFESVNNSLKCISEETEPYLQKEAELIQEYRKLLSSAAIEYKNKEFNIPQLYLYLNSNSREERKSSYIALGDWLNKEHSKFDNIYDKMVSNRTKQAKLLGFDSYTKLGYYKMNRMGYSLNDIQKFRKNVIELWIPFVHELHEQLNKELNIDQLYIYDYSIKSSKGNPNITYKKNEAIQKTKQLYDSMSKQTSAFFNDMLKDDMFDLFARKGKSGGGYSDYLYKAHLPFVFSNFVGNSDDIDTITHEFGHALGFYTADRFLNDQTLVIPNMDICEIHSMSMEFLAWKYIDFFFGKDASLYRKIHLLTSIDFICYGTMVDHFQQEVYDHPEMSPAQRRKLWIDLEKKYRPDFSNEGVSYFEKGCRWFYQGHIFTSPFYYIDYCFAQMVSFCFLIESQNNYKKAFNKYLNLIKQGGNYNFTDLLKVSGFGSIFNKETMKDIIKKLKEIRF